MMVQEGLVLAMIKDLAIDLDAGDVFSAQCTIRDALRAMGRTDISEFADLDELIVQGLPDAHRLEDYDTGAKFNTDVARRLDEAGNKVMKLGLKLTVFTVLIVLAFIIL